MNMFDFLKKVFGTKSAKDVKNLESKVEEINTIYKTLSSLSHDDLRARSAGIKVKLNAAVKTQRDAIAAIETRINAEQNMDVNTKEELYKEIDEIEKTITQELE